MGTSASPPAHFSLLSLPTPETRPMTTISWIPRRRLATYLPPLPVGARRLGQYPGRKSRSCAAVTDPSDNIHYPEQLPLYNHAAAPSSLASSATAAANPARASLARLACKRDAPAMQPDDADAARSLVDMCPSLYLAAQRGRTEEVMALLLQRHGAATADCQASGIIMHGQCSILEVTAERNTVLHVAAEQGHGELLRELYLRFRFAEQGLLSRRNSALDTPLHCAARAGSDKAVEVLVKLAQDCSEGFLGCKNEAGDTALHLAARHGLATAVEVLVSAASEPAAELNNAGVSPLYLAVMSGSVQAVRAITRACKAASSLGPSSQNALHAAVFQSSEMVGLLLEWRPALADQVDSSSSSPLHFASSDGDRKIVEAILRLAPPKAVYRKDSGGLSALHIAARMGHHRVVDGLLGSCPDAAELRDDGGRTFLHAAARAKRSSVVSRAVKSPILRRLLDAPDKDGNTPLHLAVAAGAPGVVEALLRKGKVRPDALNNDGHTALDLAAGSNSFFTMVKLVVTLVAFGAQLRPQRQDHLKKWSGRDIVHEIEKTSDSLAVVAVLIAASAFAAGFNVPGGYSDAGEANLAGKFAFKSFLFLDTVAVATSVVAVTLLVYGKVSRSAGSWKSFAAALLCMWVSLISLMLAFCTALDAVVTQRPVYQSGLVAIYLCIYLLYFCITWRIKPANTWPTLWRFLWLRSRSEGRHHVIVMRRQYPLVDVSVLYFCLFTAISLLAFFIFLFIFGKVVLHLL